MEFNPRKELAKLLGESVAKRLIERFVSAELDQDSDAPKEKTQ